MQITVIVLAAALCGSSVTHSIAPPVPQEWQIDGAHSSVVFKVKHVNATWFYGTFANVTGAVALDADAAQCKFAVTIAADSIDTRNDDRNKHLKGPDFFDVKQYATIAFKSSKVKVDGDSYLVDGELNMHGVRRPLQVTIAKTGESDSMGKRVGFETTFTIKRSDFGMTYGLAKNGIGDEVALTIAIECITPEKAEQSGK
jgi:polyisoprenoid-binding protein YceI